MRNPVNSPNRIAEFFRHTAIFAVAMVLFVVPLPEIASVFRPDFVALALIYLCWHRSESAGVFTAFAAGLLVDALTFGVLGQHALAKVCLAYGAIRVRKFAFEVSLFGQALLVLALLLGHSAIISLIRIFTQDGGGSVALWVSPFSGVIIWLSVFLITQFVNSARHVPVK